MAASRGNAISAYSPAFSKGALIYGANIQSGVVTSAHIANGTVVAGELGAGSVTSAKIGTGAVVNAKIGAGAVTSAKLGAAAIRNSGFISGGAIVAAKLKYQVISATVANSGVVYSLAHTLGRVPSIVMITPFGTVSQLKGVATTGNVVGTPTVSAHTSAVIFYAGAKNTRFKAFVMI